MLELAEENQKLKEEVATFKTQEHERKQQEIYCLMQP